MKLKNNWLKTLTDSAHCAPLGDLPEALPRTAARVLGELRQTPPYSSPRLTRLLGGVTTVLVVTLGLWLWQQGDETVSQESLADSKPPPQVSWDELFYPLDKEQATDEDTSLIWQVPTDFLLADSKAVEPFDWSQP